MKQLICEIAGQHGFDDVRLVSPRLFERWQQDGGEKKTGLCPDAGLLMPGVDSIAVLFRAYPQMAAHFSPYYICSQQGYIQSQAVADELKRRGLVALANPELPHRAAALRSGGIQGCNNLYIHPRLGSRFSLHLIMLSGCPPDEDGEVSPCAGCGRCVRSCPGGALPGFYRQRCIRHYFSGHSMPMGLRPHVLRILGCDICQDCCPHNANIGFAKPDVQIACALDIGRLLDGQVAEARALVGRNYGRSKRMACQAALYAAANNKPEYLPQIRRLVDDDYPLLADYAAYATALLEGGADCSGSL